MIFFTKSRVLWEKNFGFLPQKAVFGGENFRICLRLTFRTARSTIGYTKNKKYDIINRIFNVIFLKFTLIKYSRKDFELWVKYKEKNWVAVWALYYLVPVVQSASEMCGNFRGWWEKTVEVFLY